MARTDPQLNFRCPPELKAKLEESARANARSLTAEIVQRLEKSLTSPSEGAGGRLRSASMTELAEAMQAKMEEYKFSDPNVHADMSITVSTQSRRNSPKKG